MTPQALPMARKGPSTPSGDAKAPTTPPRTAAERKAALLASLVASLWGDEVPKKGDLDRVVSGVRLLNPSAREVPVTVAHLAALTAADARTMITPLRLFKFLDLKLTEAKVGWRKLDRFPGRRVVTDLWSQVYGRHSDKGYPWDLHLLSSNAPFASKDHDAAMTLVQGVGATVLSGMALFEDGVPEEYQRWFDGEPQPFDVMHEGCREQLRLGQLVRLDGVRWRASRCRPDDAPEAVVVAETADGYTLDRSPRMMVEAPLRAAMDAYMHETIGNGGEPRLRGFLGQLMAYLGGVLNSNADQERRKVLAMPWKAGGHRLSLVEQREQDKRAEEEASEPQPEWVKFLGKVAVR